MPILSHKVATTDSQSWQSMKIINSRYIDKHRSFFKFQEENLTLFVAKYERYANCNPSLARIIWLSVLLCTISITNNPLGMIITSPHLAAKYSTSLFFRFDFICSGSLHRLTVKFKEIKFTSKVIMLSVAQPW